MYAPPASGRNAFDCWVHGVADLLTRFDAEEAVCIMAVVCDAADPTTEAELTRTRRSRGQARQAGVDAGTGHGQPPG